MSRLHVLESSNTLNIYRVILHEATPVGANSAGMPWESVLVGAGLARTRMVVGTGPGMITTDEKTSIEAGEIVEGEFYFQDDPVHNNDQRTAALDAHATRYLAELQQLISVKYKWFGATRP